ncbi:MAG: hypothetical protein ABW189_05255 [Rickettsiales bacterium]
MPHNDLIARIDPTLIYALALIGAYFALIIAWKTLKLLWRKTRAFFRNVAEMETDEDDAQKSVSRMEEELRARRSTFDDAPDVYMHIPDDRHP